MKLAGLHHRGSLAEPVWHVQLAVLVAIGLQLSLSSSLTVGSKYVTAGIEVFLLGALATVKPGIKSARLNTRRFLAILLIALISLANLISLVAVIDALFNSIDVNGRNLLLSAGAIYLTNIIIFGLWYWELDNVDDTERDFLFPQMSSSASVTKQTDWNPTFFDYLYVSITNASAFSPTDTMPLTKRIKLLMTFQALISLITVALVAARAVNILA
jgi:uncharacterized membrane protein